MVLPARRVPAEEVTAQFDRMLDRVAAGESFTIVRDGRVVAQLVPEVDREADAARGEEAVRAMLALEGCATGGSLAEAMRWKDEGRP